MLLAYSTYGRVRYAMDSHTDTAVVARGLTRLLIGLAQGITLYLLYLAADAKAWPATQATTFAPLVLVAWFVPIILLLGTGNMRLRTLVAWSVVAAALLAGFAVYDIDRGATAGWIGTWLTVGATGPLLWPSPRLVFLAAMGGFIAQTLIVAGDADGRLIGFYSRHFDAAWKHAVQLALSAAFVGAFWLLLWLGAALFKLVNITFFAELIRHRWFAYPATTLALAGAVHVTDVQAGLVRGMRTLLLTLLSWLLPLLALIVAGFLASLPFTGLAPLWSTRFATALLLNASAALVLLINAAYQDGAPEHLPNRVLRHAGSLGALTLAPMVAIAAYALTLRVEQHGWTTDRILAAACITIAVCYALGYAWAAFSRGSWLKPIKRCNVATAVVILGVGVALLTPIADPARLSVASQLARLRSGQTPADKFDFTYLRLQGARYGRAALEQLKNKAEGPQAAAIQRGAEQALALPEPGRPVPRVAPTPEQLVNNIQVFPPGRVLPQSFLHQNWSAAPQPYLLPNCLVSAANRCEAYLLDIDGDGADEVLVADQFPVGSVKVLKQASDGNWRVAATSFSLFMRCDKVRQALRAGEIKLVAPLWRDIEVAGVKLHFDALGQVPVANTCP
ncbi:MAG TPA: DUF4153 domain-containing protein [Stellaceae bacterium]|nr:DUF4153 domain-containing protein [Stellaceae bacterium]